MAEDANQVGCGPATGAAVLALSSPPGWNGTERQAVKEQIVRIISSDIFAGSRRSREFLIHVADKALSGQTELLKERLIGIQLYGKDNTYDTVMDSTVRVRAHEVRRRLLQYAEQYGREEAYRIILPVGSYVPEFRPLAIERQPPWVAAASEATKHAPPNARARPGRRWMFVPALAGLFLCGLIFRWMVSYDWLFNAFWDPLIGGNAHIALVLEETANPGERASLGRVRGLLRVDEVAQQFGAHFSDVHVGPFPALRDRPFQVYLGKTSPLSSRSLRYQLRQAETGPAIIDMRTARVYESGSAGAREQSYALVSRILPRATGPGVLALNGTSDAALEAAADLVTSRAALDEALSRLSVTSLQDDLQILLSVEHSGADLLKYEVIAVEAFPFN
jgi:hypothetical protein